MNCLWNNLEDSLLAIATTSATNITPSWTTWHLTVAAMFSVVLQLIAIIAVARERAWRINADLFTVSVVSLTLVNVCCNKAKRRTGFITSCHMTGIHVTIWDKGHINQLITRLEAGLQPNIAFTFESDLMVFTRSWVTPPKVNRFVWNLEHLQPRTIHERACLDRGLCCF